jgi:DNA-directed RNA polymerase specialized sigma24 family protein
MATRKRKASSKARSVKTQTTISRASKQHRMVEMLRRSEGATIAQLGEAFGWQAHTVRSAISGALKKKLGLKVVSDKDAGGDRVYRIV